MTALTTCAMRSRLVARFGGTTTAVLVPEHLVLFEVAIDGPPRFPDANHEELLAYRKRQRIDAVAVGLWGRTKHLVHGIEIKVSRSDLLRELRDPGKSAAGRAACDRWWLALGDAHLLRDGDDLPDGCGVLVPRGRGLGVLVEPEPTEGVRDGRFIAALLQAGLRSPRYRYALGRRAGYEDADRHWKNRERAWRRQEEQHIAAGCQLAAGGAR